MAMPLFFPWSAFGQNTEIQQFSVGDDLPSNEIRSIFQDEKGFMWFGTYGGLKRYDGYSFKSYYNNPADGHSINDNYIRCMAQDAQKRLWVGTPFGVNVYNALNDNFDAVYAHRGNEPEHPIRSSVIAIRAGKGNTMYVGLSDGNGMVQFNNSVHGTCIPLQADKTPFTYSVQAMNIGPDGRVYVMVENRGLYQYSATKRQLTLIDTTVKTAGCMVVESDGIWIGNGQGLLHYNFGIHTYDKKLSEGLGSITSNRVMDIVVTADNQIWLATDGGGINVYNRLNGRMSYLSADSKPYHLSSNAVVVIYVDRYQRKWIGTLRGGVDVIDNHPFPFHCITRDPNNSNSLINNFIKSVFEDADGQVWIGTDGGGLSIWNREHNSFQNFSHQIEKKNTLSSNFITGITQDEKKRIWISTFGGGINQYQPQSHSFKTYYAARYHKSPASVFWMVYTDNQHRLWANGLQDGLFIYNEQQDRFDQLDGSVKNIISMFTDREGNFWGGTFGGIYRIDPVNKRHRFCATSGAVRAIHQDKWGNLWLGTEAGLMLYDARGNKIVHTYTTDDGLCNNGVLNIEEDDSGHLWMSTFSGLSRFDIRNKVFVNFSQKEGLNNKQYNFNASVRFKNGQLAFGGLNGLSYFDPAGIRFVNSDNNLELTDVKINNSPLAQKNAYVSLGKDSLVTLRIPYNEASLAISFAAINFTEQDRIKYRYQMAGWDRGWNLPVNTRTAIYTILQPGNYIFKVNCSNSEGQWLNKQAMLRVIILPPWYQTWWAYAIYFALCLAALYWYIQYRLRENKLLYEIKLAKANAETQRLLQEKERETNEQRIEFFSGIAHEFRTPLSLIINPIRDWLSKTPVPDNDLKVVYRNAKRLLSLVNQLLLFRKVDVGLNKIKVSPVDMADVCNVVFESFNQQAKLAGITLEFAGKPGLPMVYAEREKVEIILFNLVSNAIKYTPRGGRVNLSIDESEQEVIVSVSNTGAGIPADVGDKLFDRFYRVDSGSKEQQRSGFGIGLYLAKQFAVQHQAGLGYTSTLGIGTTFTLSLKKGFAHFKPDEIIEGEASTATELLTELAVEPIMVEQPNGKRDELFTDKPSVLIIDDDDELRQYIASVLINSNYLVYQANNGLDGMEMAKADPPNIIICDVMMPGISGIELCALIKQDEQLSYIPMILLTASTSLESKIKGLENGADDYIIKPFDKDVLIARVANLLQNRKNLQGYFYNAITLRTDYIAVSEEYKQFLEKCIHIVERHITDPDFGVKVLVDELGMSHSNIYRKVKSLSGHNIGSFIRLIRLRKAAELLIGSDFNINQVALEVGYSNVKYFREQFIKVFGVTPSDYVRNNRPVYQKKYKVRK